MKLNARAMAIATGLLWGGAMLVAGVAGMLSPGFADQFLSLMSSVYPGYDAQGTVVSVLIGTGYALVDGAIGGWLLAWLYNMFAE